MADDENIFLFIPNLIGYARIIFAFVSFYFMPTNYIVASIFYLLSGLLDAFDGWAARRFNQGTSFGAVLDMVTDRCATTCLIVILGYFYPAWLMLWQTLIALDIGSHWVQMYSCLLHGESTHKVTDLAANPIMRFYYTRPVLFTFCAGNELFFAAVYILHFTAGYTVTLFGHSIGIWYILAGVSLPISFLKQVVSVVQLVAACRNLGALDVVARARQRDQHTIVS